MAWQTAVALGALSCVAIVVGVRNLSNVMRTAWARHRSAAVVLGTLTVLVVAAALANPDVWPLFAMGYPSLASVVVGSWIEAREGARRRSRPGAKRRQGLPDRPAGAWPQVVPRRAARLARRHA